VSTSIKPKVDQQAMITCLSELIKIPSVTGTDAESTAQHWFADRMRETGLETDLWQIDLPVVTSAPDFPGLEAPREDAWGLVGSWGGSDGPSLVLNGHIDVVPPGDLSQWSAKDPYSGEVSDGKVFGRGACDMKAGLVAELFAIKAIRDAGINLKGKILLQSVVGEEDGGLGTFATLQRGYRGDAAIIAEPTELNIVPACAGALTFRLHVKGRSIHASIRKKGISTIEKFWSIWQALEELEVSRNQNANSLMSCFDLPYALNVGILRAGEWASSVPDQLTCEGRLGVALGEQPEDARRDFEQAIARVCEKDTWLRENPVRVEWFGGQFASGQLAADHPLVALVSESHQKLHGNKPVVRGAPYGSDLRLMTAAKIPTLHYGPGSVDQAHAPNEFVLISDMVAAAATLVEIITKFCGVREGA
jgi:acetylornithine deacetylase